MDLPVPAVRERRRADAVARRMARRDAMTTTGYPRRQRLLAVAFWVLVAIAVPLAAALAVA